MVDTDRGFSVPELAQARRRRNPAADFFVRLVRTKPLGTVSAVIVLVFFFAGVFADLLAPYGLNESFRRELLQPPSAEHWLGTDPIGRDLFSRIIGGARISMMVGVIGSLVSLVVSCAIGLPSGYFGGKFDLFVQRFIDAWITFPDVVLLIFLVTIIGQGLWTIIFVLGIAYGFSGSRSVRGATIGIRQNVYLESAGAIGATTPRILLRHMLPNIAPFLLVLVTTRMPGMMLAEAGLSFLGARRASSGAQLGGNAQWVRDRQDVLRPLAVDMAWPCPEYRRIQHKHVRGRAERPVGPEAKGRGGNRRGSAVTVNPSGPGPFQSWLTMEGHTPPPTWIPACAGMTVCGFRDNGKALHPGGFAFRTYLEVRTKTPSARSN